MRRYLYAIMALSIVGCGGATKDKTPEKQNDQVETIDSDTTGTQNDTPECPMTPYEPSVKELPETELDIIERTDQQEEQNTDTPDLIFIEEASAFDDIDFSFEEEEVEEEIEGYDEAIFGIWEEEPATFRGGGLPEFRNLVMERLRYPQFAQENGIQGTVIVEFVVDANGDITRIQVLQSPDPVLSDAVISVMKKAPKWEPAKCNGRAVRSKFVLPPVSFKLYN